MRSAISSPVGPGNVPVEDGDVVGVDAQQLQSGRRRHLRCPPRSLPGVGRRGWLPPCRARPRRSAHACSDATSRRISPAYRKPHTCWQHHAALNGGMTYREPARTTTRRIRIRRIRVAGLLVVIAAIAAALGYQLPASSSSTAASPVDVLRSEHAVRSASAAQHGVAGRRPGRVRPDRTVADPGRPEPARGCDRQRREGDDGLSRAP